MLNALCAFSASLQFVQRHRVVINLLSIARCCFSQFVFVVISETCLGDKLQIPLLVQMPKVVELFDRSNQSTRSAVSIVQQQPSTRQYVKLLFVNLAHPAKMPLNTLPDAFDLLCLLMFQRFQPFCEVSIKPFVPIFFTDGDRNGSSTTG